MGGRSLLFAPETWSNLANTNIKTNITKEVNHSLGWSWAFIRKNIRLGCPERLFTWRVLWLDIDEVTVYSLSIWFDGLTSPSRGLILNVFILAWGLIMASFCSKSLGTVDPQLFRHSCTSPPPSPQNQGDLSTPIPRSSFPSEKKKNRVVSNLLKLWNLLFLNMTCIKKYRKRKCW